MRPGLLLAILSRSPGRRVQSLAARGERCRSSGTCWRSWASTGGPGALFGPRCAVLGRSWRLCWRSWLHLDGSWGLGWQSWAALGAYVAGRGLLFGPLCAILGRSCGLCWRSQAALWTYVGGLGPKDVKNMATLTHAYFSSGSAICGLGVSLGLLFGRMLAVLGRS